MQTADDSRTDALATLLVIVQVDSALLSHPAVTEAVSFGAPDEKYGEVVAAAVVLDKPADDQAALIKDIQRVTGEKLAAFKVRSAWGRTNANCGC